MADRLVALKRKLSKLRIAPDGVPEWRADLISRYNSLPTIMGPFALQEDYTRDGGACGTWSISVELKDKQADIEGGFPTPYDALRRMIDYAEAWDEVKPREQVYFIGTELRIGRAIKVGYSRDPEGRLRTLQTGHAERLQIFATVEGGRDLESKYHRRWRNRRQKGEWFTIGECIIAEIARIKGEAA